MSTLYHALVNLSPSGNVQFCPGDPACFSCETEIGELIWRTNSAAGSSLYSDVSQSPVILGIFNLKVINVIMSGGMVTRVNSTAAVSSIEPSHDGVNLMCTESRDTTMVKEAVISVLGEYWYMHLANIILVAVQLYKL